MKLLTSLWNLINPDRRPDSEKARERDFIAAANGLKTLSVTDRGGMSIDPEELRNQIVASREQLKHLVYRPEAPNRSFRAAEGAQVEPLVSPTVETPVSPGGAKVSALRASIPHACALRLPCLPGA